MAKVAHTFSPKEFTVWIATDNTAAGTTGIHASNMYQLDVDSVSMPTLNVNQVLDVRSGAGRVLKDEDFFQDNKLRVVELSLSGTLHNDAGHKLLLQNICNDVSGDPAIATGFTPASQKYGAAVANVASSLTVVIKASDHTNQKSLEMPGFVVTNFSMTADNGTEGGRYKFSATLQSGIVPDLNEASTAAGNNVYAVTTDAFLSSSSGHQVFATDVIMNSFTVTLENPAVFTGATTTGYEVVSRGAEMAVTVDTSVKYDGNTKSFIHSFDSQTAFTDGNMFVIINDNAFGVSMPDGVLTNVAYNEGDIMMLDVSMKGVDAGADVITFDVTD